MGERNSEGWPGVILAVVSDRSTLYHWVVRVKKENEVSDSNRDAMVSPASLRNFGFGAICLHANDAGGTPSDSMGRGVPERPDGH